MSTGPRSPTSRHFHRPDQFRRRRLLCAGGSTTNQGWEATVAVVPTTGLQVILTVYKGSVLNQAANGFPPAFGNSWSAFTRYDFAKTSAQASLGAGAAGSDRSIFLTGGVTFRWAGPCRLTRRYKRGIDTLAFINYTINKHWTVNPNCDNVLDDRYALGVQSAQSSIRTRHVISASRRVSASNCTGEEQNPSPRKEPLLLRRGRQEGALPGFFRPPALPARFGSRLILPAAPSPFWSRPSSNGPADATIWPSPSRRDFSSMTGTSKPSNSSASTLLPDRQRWRLIELNGKPATDEQRRAWEAKKNRKPRKKVAKAPSDYVDLEHAVVLDETPLQAHFEIRLRQDVARLLGVSQLSAIVTVDKNSGSIVHVTAALRQPMRVLMGLAKITDLDVDVHIEPSTEDSGDVQTGSTARVAISELGYPVEYTWSDFARVTPFRSALKTD